jgi:hypothetical protein
VGKIAQKYNLIIPVVAHPEDGPVEKSWNIGDFKDLFSKFYMRDGKY